MRDVERLLQAAAATPYAEPAARLAARIASTAALHGLLDVAYATVDSPFGPLVVASTARGVIRLSFGPLDVVLARLATDVSPRILLAPARLDDVRRQLDEYFEGRRKRFDLRLDRRPSGEFQRRVLQVASRIPYGRVRSYGDVATRSGSPSGARAAGRALGANPIPILVPCHRVVGANGGLGGYTGGTDRKRSLLELEGVDIGGRVLSR